MEDDVKKMQDWHWKDHPEEALQISDDDYHSSTMFFNLVRDVSLLQFGDALSKRIMPLLLPTTNQTQIASEI